MIAVSLPTEYLVASPRDVKNSPSYQMAGIYVFMDQNERALYVGKSVNFYNRFTTHASRSSFFHKANHVRLYLVEDDYERDIYETAFIREFNPIHNKDKMYHDRILYEDEFASIDDEINELTSRLEELKHDLYDDDSDDKMYAEEDELLGELLHAVSEIDEINTEIGRLNTRKRALMARRGR